MMWPAGALLDQVQELLAQEPGDFYNISSRLRLLNTAQRDMVDFTDALTTTRTIPLTNGTYPLPDDFLSFAKGDVLYDDHTRQTPVEIITATSLSERLPQYHRANRSGRPRYGVREGRSLKLYPPPQTGQVTIPYTVKPADMLLDEDLPFNGNPDYERFALALAYFAASTVMMPRSPDLAGYYYNVFEKMRGEMLEFVRNNPQLKRYVRPTPITEWI